MNVQRITTETSRANELLSNGWRIVDHKLAVAAGGMNTEGLTDRGLEYVANKITVEARTYVLELEDAERHTLGYGENPCLGCNKCNMTGFIKKR